MDNFSTLYYFRLIEKILYPKHKRSNITNDVYRVVGTLVTREKTFEGEKYTNILLHVVHDLHYEKWVKY